MGTLPRKRVPNPKQVYFLFREDIRHMQSMAREVRLMAKRGIDTAEQLAAYKDGANAQIAALSGARKHLRGKARSAGDEDALAAIKTQISELSAQIKELRREVRLYENIERRSGEMKGKLHRAKEAKLREKTQRKEPMRDEPFRRRRRTDRSHESGGR
jgi:outer membrane murein-binding lipoprotein Lpp